VSQPCSCKCQNLTAERFDEARTQDKGWKPLSGIGWDRFAQMVAFQPTGSSHICTQRLKQAFLTMQRFWPRGDLDDIVDQQSMVTGEFPIQMQWGKEGSVLIQVVNILDFHNTSGSGHLHLHLGFNLYACLP